MGGEIVANPVQPIVEGSSERKWIWIPVVGVVVILLVVGGILIWSNDPSKFRDFHIATILCQKECPLEEIVINYTDDEDYVGNIPETEYYRGAESFYSTQEFWGCAVECRDNAMEKYPIVKEGQEAVRFSQETQWEIVIVSCASDYFTLEEIKICAEDHLKEYYSQSQIDKIREEANL